MIIQVTINLLKMPLRDPSIASIMNLLTQPQLQPRLGSTCRFARVNKKRGKSLNIKMHVCELFNYYQMPLRYQITNLSPTTCASCSTLPSDINTMGGTIDKAAKKVRKFIKLCSESFVRPFRYGVSTFRLLP